ncbi:MAG: DUF4249 family protein [Cryomorphaceae bacterium]|nr:DUF4249 family protein [Cryomorphaceae bacterium]
MKRIVIILPMLMLFACEQIIDLDLPEHEPKLVLNGFFIAHEEGVDTLPQNIKSSLFQTSFSISVSKGTTTSGEIRYLTDANLEIHENQIPIAFMDSSNEGTPFGNKYFPDIEVEPGNTYSAYANHPEFDDEVFAGQTIPSFPVITDVSIRTSGSDKIITFTIDDPSEVNFYIIRLFTSTYPFFQGSQYFVNLFSIVDADYIGLNENDGLEAGLRTATIGILRDNNFNGQKKTLEMRVPELFVGMPDDETLFLLKITSATRDMNLYMRSYYQMIEGNFTPFSEPTIIHFNVENGYGSVLGGAEVVKAIFP